MSLRNKFSFLHYLAAGLFVVTALLPSRAAAGEDSNSLRIIVQSCHEEEFEFLFNEDARVRFKTCETPLVEFDVMLSSAVGSIATALSDDNGQAVLEVADVAESEILRLAVCKKETSCMSYSGLSIAEGPLKYGENFVLYLDGRKGE